MKTNYLIALFAILILAGVLLPYRVIVVENKPGQMQETPVPCLDPDGCMYTFEHTTVTRYSALDSCHYPTPDGGCLMKSGKVAYPGAAACPRDLPVGTRIAINSEKYTCEDWYSTSLARRFDLWTGYDKQAHTDALKFGKQKLIITIYGTRY